MTNYNPNTTDIQSEMLTEVDESDNLIGPVARVECHNQTRKPWHRSTHIYLFDQNGRIYFSQRSFKKDTGAGMWTVAAGGHIRFGESPKSTAKNELYEELKIKTNLELIDKFHIDYGSEKEILYIYFGITNQEPVINPEELIQIKAFELEEIIEDFQKNKFDLSGGSRDSFRYLIDNGALINYRIRMFGE